MLQSQARREVLHILGLLACAREPLTLRMLTQFLGQETADRMEDLLTVAADFFGGRPVGRAPDAPFRFFHSRFQEFILEQISDFQADLHAQLAKGCLRWRDLDDPARRYALRYLPTHLTAGRLWDALCDLLTDFDYLQAKIGALAVSTEQSPPPATVFDLLSDFQNALVALPANHPLKAAVTELHSATDQNSHVLKNDPSLFVQQVHNYYAWDEMTDLGSGVHNAARRYARVWLKRLNCSTSNAILLRTLVDDKCAEVTALQWAPGKDKPSKGVVGIGYKDGTLRCWDLSTGRKFCQVELDGSEVLAVGFAHHGTELCAFTARSLLAILNLATGQLRTHNFDNGTPKCGAFATPSSDGHQPMLAFWTEKNELVVVRSQDSVQVIPHEVRGKILAMTFLGHKKVILAGIADYHSHQYIGGGQYSPASLVKVLSLDGTEEVVNCGVGGRGGYGPYGSIESISSTDDGKSFVTASHVAATDEHSEFEYLYLGLVAVWQQTDGVWQPSLRASQGTAGSFAVAFCPDRGQLIGVVWNDGLVLWDSDGKRIASIGLPSEHCRTLCITREHSPTVLVGEGSAIKCFELDNIDKLPFNREIFRHSLKVGAHPLIL